MINIRGVTLSLHPLFVIVMLMSILTGSFIELITLFVIVLIHEMGHMSAAVVMGIKVRSVQLLPFGGVVSIEDHGKLTAWKEIIIALAGPLQNGIMMVIGMTFMAVGWGNIEFISYIVHGNMVIAVFNLLPILPLDGGKILQSLASRYYPYHFTLLWSSRVSIVTSMVVILFSLLPLIKGEGIIQLNILMIGIFLFYSNLIDYRNLPYRFMRFLMNRDSIHIKYSAKGTNAHPIIVDAAKHLENILRLFKREKYHLIYIMDKNGKIIVVLPEQRLISAYFSQGRRLP
ncbi:M50 family metallopeptidase [Paenibacillus glacialis]|uniref:Zn-dependent protease n=1 Tax=Paenibacillus glacialis TaxID=494026 RepID=A0A168PDF2_9BACL|nr:M50 family metallopeptidase [Paenibacillus glacialis]OAB46659.1 Zn-dependent protease [Paenibacillus glacialis]